MRNVQAGLVDLVVSIHEEVEVERSRPVWDGVLAAAAEATLDVEQHREELSRGERGVDRGDAVEEAWLVDDADRLGVDEGRDGDHCDAGLLERREACADRLLPIAEVRAEADVCARHGA